VFVDSDQVPYGRMPRGEAVPNNFLLDGSDCIGIVLLDAANWR